MKANIAVVNADDPKMNLNVSFDMRVGSKHAKKVLNKIDLDRNARAYKNNKSVSPQSKIQEAQPRHVYGRYEDSKNNRYQVNAYNHVTLDSNVDRKPKRQESGMSADPYTPMDMAVPKKIINRNIKPRQRTQIGNDSNASNDDSSHYNTFEINQSVGRNLQQNRSSSLAQIQG